MRKKLLFGIVLLISLATEYTSAQTIYHYRVVATVDSQTGVKSAKSGWNEHIMFINGQACRCNEYGKPYDEFIGSTIQYGVRLTYTGKMYHLDFLKKENDINIYHTNFTRLSEDLRYECGPNYAKGGEWIVVKSEKETSDLYLYFSKDYSRLNYISEDNNSKKGKSTEIYVFELYDTDEVNKSTFDARNPTRMY